MQIPLKILSDLRERSDKLPWIKSFSSVVVNHPNTLCLPRAAPMVSSLHEKRLSITLKSAYRNCKVQLGQPLAISLARLRDETYV